MRLGQSVRNAGREHQRVKPARHLRRAHERETFRALAGGSGIVPDEHLRAHVAQRPGRRQPGAAKAQHRETLALEDRCEIHRIFKVASPTSPRIIATIQKRITIVGSAQPFFSK